jgi:hypothetical protein
LPSCYESLFNTFGFQTEHKIVLVGLDNAGKTTILYQFLMNEVVHTSPTIGSNVEEVVWKNIHFIMWDLGGQESLRAAWNTYYTNTEVSPHFVSMSRCHTFRFFFPFLVRYTSGGFHRPGTLVRHSTRAPQNPGSRRAASRSCSGAGQQTGRKRCHDSSRDFSSPESDFYKETQVADPGLLCSDW